MRRLAIVMMVLWVILGIMPTWAQADTMQLRIAHWSTDAPTVDIYANGEVVVKSLAYPTVTDWMALEAGVYDIAIAPAGTSLEEAVIGPMTFNLVDDTWVTIAAVGSVEADTLATNVLIENYSPLRDADFARVSITHAVDGAQPISMMVNDLTAVSSLAYPGKKGNNDGFFTREVEAGISDIRVFITNEPDVELANESDIVLEAGMNYLLAAIGTSDAPELLIVASSLDGEMTMVSDVEAMSAGAMTDDEMVEDTDDEAMTDDEMTEDESEMSNTIADIVVATEAEEAEFSVLLAALMIADESIVTTLGDPEADLTVFAPTDEAFVALLDSMEIDIDALLNDTELLNRVLQYHVVEGAMMAETVLTMDGEVVPTLLGDSATILITVTDDEVVLNEGINVITTDIVAENGVIHVIDGVLVPETE